MPTSRTKLDILNADATEVLIKDALVDYGVAASGSLPTQVFSTGTGAQISTTRTVTAYVQVTNTSAAGTATIALSPDNSTYSNIGAITTTVTATVITTAVVVPAGWYMKVTFSNATIVVTYA